MTMGTIIEVISEDGYGKTYGICSFPEEICILDVDGKANKTIESFFNDKIINVIPCLVHYNKSDISHDVLRGNLNVDKTMDAILHGISMILDDMENYETVVIDGISDLKRITTQYWLLHDPKHRKAISPENLAARAEINNIVKEKMLFPLINTARALNKTLIFTSKMKDVYGLIEGEDGKMHNMKTGLKEADVSEWVGYKMDIKVTLNRDKSGKFWVYWDRALQLNLPVREDITGKSLYSVMVERKVI